MDTSKLTKAQLIDVVIGLESDIAKLTEEVQALRVSNPRKARAHNISNIQAQAKALAISGTPAKVVGGKLLTQQDGEWKEHTPA